MNKANYDIVNNYWGLLKNLRSSWKLALIERLQQSLSQESSSKTNTIQQAFGAWEAGETAENLIQKIRDSRSTHREIESL